MKQILDNVMVYHGAFSTELQLSLDTEKEENRLLREQLQLTEVRSLFMCLLFFVEM